MRRGKTNYDWIPLWTDKWLWGSTRHELTHSERAIWIDLLVLASKDDGFIRANETTAYPIQQLAGMFCCDQLLLESTIAKCLDPKIAKMVKVENGILSIINWQEYQLTDRYKRLISPKTEVGSENLYGLSVSVSLSSLILISSKWNSFSEKYKLSKIDSIKKGSTRERNLILRIEQDGFDIDKVIEKIEKQPFLLGDNKQGWTVNFDFIVKASSYQKIMEEVYLKRQRGVTPEEQKKIEWEKRNKAIDELERKK